MEKWCLQRKNDLDTIRDIQEKANKTSTKLIPGRRKKLEEKLGVVLKNTLQGLGKLQCFLEAVEKLSVTSLFVFTDDCSLPIGVSAEDVRSVIFAARKAAPLLVHFKRDDSAFFFPSLSNVAVLAYQLDKYMSVLQQLYERLEERWPRRDQAINFSVDTEEESIQRMLNHLNQLNLTRTNQDLRLTHLFLNSALSFIGLFSQRHKRMLQFLSDLEESARELDKMKFGANISSVAGSSFGVIGGVVSIVGLALAPVTAGASLALTLAGVGLGVTSGVNSLVTGVTEIVVSKKHGKKAQNTFQSFMENVQKLLDCIELVASSKGPAIAVEQTSAFEHEHNVLIKAGIAFGTVGTIGKGIDGLVDAASAVKVLQTEKVVANAVKLGLQEANAGRNIPKLAADLPDIAQIAKGTPLALSKSARSGFIGLNALFIGLDVFFICKDSISLSKGSKHEMAQLIRSRAALWRSELDSWERIQHSLCRGFGEFSSSQKILEQPFYPD
ncbi:hypothetical protein ACEWY4_003136 [Coilia grayii]|uniref:Uncharacterized protein n=1 Tax=Coilia grayii TaxID=363190 RepID=A0ABD1KQC9_9TELE